VRSGLFPAVLRVVGTLIAGLVIVSVVFDGSLRYALAVGLVVGLGYAAAAAAYDRFDGS
jgi:hypothetical protein